MILQKQTSVAQLLVALTTEGNLVACSLERQCFDFSIRHRLKIIQQG